MIPSDSPEQEAMRAGLREAVTLLDRLITREETAMAKCKACGYEMGKAKACPHCGKK